MRAKSRGHVGPRNRASRAGRCVIAFVTFSINYALASALDLAGLSILLWLFLAYCASVFLVVYAQSL
jgi:hypothetical protein